MGRFARLFRGMSLPKKIITMVLAVAAALGTLWGAVQAVEGVSTLISDRNKRANPPQLARTQNLGIEIWQDDKKQGLFEPEPRVGYNSSRADLDASPFELRFPIKYADLALQLVAWTDPSVYKVQPPISEDSPNFFFSLGTGMADSNSASSVLFLSDDAHSYFVGSRIAAISGVQGAVYFNATYDTDTRGLGERQSLPVSAQKGKDLYLVAYVDFDDDGVLENGEYDYIQLDF